ncbi:MAG: dihydroneopterin aldolase [Spirochaetota bacterium]
MQDKIFFHNLRFYAYHGVFRHEEIRGQYFELDLELSCNLQKSGCTGQLSDSIDYGEVYHLVKTIVTEQRFALLEALGEHLCAQILEQFSPIQNVMLRLRKPEAPLEGGILSIDAAESIEENKGAAEPELRQELDQELRNTPWNCGLFGPGGSVGIELHRSRPLSQEPRK